MVQQLAIQIEGYDGKYSMAGPRQDLFFSTGEVTGQAAPTVC